MSSISRLQPEVDFYNESQCTLSCDEAYMRSVSTCIEHTHLTEQRMNNLSPQFFASTFLFRDWTRMVVRVPTIPMFLV